MNTFKSLFASAGVIALSVLSGCSDSTSSAASNIIDVTPSKGAFSSGAVVEVYDASSGTKVGSGTVGSSGKASIDTGSTKGAIILKVVSGSYYDEGSDSILTLDAPLISLVPSASAGSNFGVTPLTNMAAEMAGVTASSSSSGVTIPTGGVSSTTITSTNGALLSLLGLDATAFSITDAPTLVKTSSDTVSSGAAGLYALVLAKISFDAQADTSVSCGSRTTAECKAYRATTMLSSLKTAAANAFSSPTKTFSAPAALGINATTGMSFTNVSGWSGGTSATSAIAAKVAAPVTTITDAKNIASASIYCKDSSGNTVTNKLDPLYAGNAATLSSALTTGTGTFTITVNGTNYQYNITYANGKIYGIPNSGSSSQSGVFSGSVSGSSGGSDGWLANSIYLLSGISGSGTLTLNYSGGSGTYAIGMGNADSSGQKKLTLTCS